jgi:hypothetical protein
MSYFKKFHFAIYLLFQTTYQQQQPIRILSRQTKKGIYTLKRETLSKELKELKKEGLNSQRFLLTP